MGLNNYSQMGIDHNKSGLTFFMPVESELLSVGNWDKIAIGQHHTLGLDNHGHVYCLGRSEYGRYDFVHSIYISDKKKMDI